MATTVLPADYDRAKQVKEFDDSKIGVKGLVDAGATVIPRFFIHRPEILHQLNNTLTKEIPVVDLAGMDSDRRSKIVEQIRDASHSWGFFQVINHGIPVSVLGETISAVRSFHEQSTAQKSEFYTRDRIKRFRFLSNFDLFLTDAANWRDTFQVQMESLVDNIPASCRKEIDTWHDRTTGLAERLMALMCEGLGVDPGCLEGVSCMLMAAHYYPYCPQPGLTLGSSGHSDSGLLTVLLQDGIGGLQVKHSEEWVAVRPVAGALVINVGDFLEIISNGEYKSVEHRVLANNYREPRISIAMFFGPCKRGGNDFYGPLSDLLSPENPPLYRNFTVGEYMGRFVKKGQYGKAYLDAFKL